MNQTTVHFTISRVFFFITGRKMLPKAREERRAAPGWLRILLRDPEDGHVIEPEISHTIFYSSHF
jgi:hypothetical protein